MVVSVNGITISEQQVEQELDTLLMQYADRVPREQLPMMRPKLRDQAVENLINKLLLINEADRRKIAPGAQEIDEQIQAIAGRFSTPDEFQQRMTERQGIRRLGTPEDVAAVALFLCSPEARHLQGVSIGVDGGATKGLF